MAHKRKRGVKWEFTVKRSGLLEKPITLTFDREEDGDSYCRRLEALLDRGIVPTQHQIAPSAYTIEILARQYEREVAVPAKDVSALNSMIKSIGGSSAALIDAAWVDEWIATMKRESKHAPSTIRAKVGALARLMDWAMRKKLVVLPDHPLRTLRDGYASYTPADAAIAGISREDNERDRRIEGDEEDRVRAVIERGVLTRKQRPFTIPHQSSVMTLFDVALETAMRLRETYTLTVDQINLKHRTLFLSKTKNGCSRQVPLTSVAVRVLESHMDGKSDYIFPWLEEQRGDLKLTSNYLSKLFAGIFEEAGCGDLHYHDLRREATSRLFERTTLTTEEIMRITGHKGHRMMMRYLRLRPDSLTSKLW